VEKDSPTTRSRSRAEGLVGIMLFLEVSALLSESRVGGELMQGCDEPAKGSLGKHLIKGWLFSRKTGTGVDLPICPL